MIHLRLLLTMQQIDFFVRDKRLARASEQHDRPCSLTIKVPRPPVFSNGEVQGSYPCLCTRERYYEVMVSTARLSK
jgi:hypothetical protein